MEGHHFHHHIKLNEHIYNETSLYQFYRTKIVVQQDKVYVCMCEIIVSPVVHIRYQYLAHDKIVTARCVGIHQDH